MDFLLILAIIIFYFVCETKGDFRSHNDGLPPLPNAIMGIIAMVMRADNATTKSELTIVKNYLLNTFGEEKAKQHLLILRDILQNKEIRDFRPHCVRINRNLKYSEKLQLLTLFFSIAKANNGDPTQEEKKIIYLYARYTGIRQYDLIQIQTEIFGNTNNYHQKDYRRPNKDQSDLKKAYQILNLSPTATDAELKHAFRQMAKKWHPDKLTGHSDNEIQEATRMFREINNAYNFICERRGL